ncbi:hypothetical protein [Azorhizobium sp. AG788]|uniref:hypothetical protein n=1 Tax=Azorhizobium sp. AG788 TaxID=2183897 RepID=UPI003138863E
MHARELELLLPSLSGRTSADLDLRFRELRKLRMLPTGGRGRHAPEIGAEHVATILIAVAGASKAIDAAYAVTRFAGLGEVGSAGETFAEALTDILDSEELARVVKSVRLCHSHTFAEIEYDGGRPARRFFQEEDIAKMEKGLGTVEGFAGASIMDQTVIGGAVIHQLSIDLNEDDEEGELVIEASGPTETEGRK